MKIQELRIGNWYMSVKFQQPVMCDLLDFYDLCAKSDGVYDDPPINEMFSPIPITEEWLGKFGFKKHKAEDNYFYKKWGNNGVEFIFNSDRYSRNVFEYELGSNKYKQIKYVHQLQNLYFALTGKELEIS